MNAGIANTTQSGIILDVTANIEPAKNAVPATPIAYAAAEAIAYLEKSSD